MSIHTLKDILLESQETNLTGLLTALEAPLKRLPRTTNVKVRFLVLCTSLTLIKVNRIIVILTAKAHAGPHAC
jgi:hypothetical protein